MARVRVHNFAISLDGYGAGPDQSLEDPLGVGGTRLHEWALEAADGRDVRIGGGAATVQQYLRAGLIDELHLAIVPILLGAGERLFEDVGGDLSSRYECVELASSDAAAHVRLARREGSDGS